MTHRGAVGSDARDGDGAGVMTSIPHKFFIKNFERETGYKLPPQGQYAAGNLFFKPDTDMLKESTTTFEEIAESLDLRVLGWREVPRDSSLLGPAALSREPLILQPFVVLKSAYGNGNEPEIIDSNHFDEKNFERQLYVLRKRATHTIGLHNWFYLCSLSNKSIVYKGQLAPVQVYQYYHDLVSVDYEGHFALVHSRFSTNTFPSWDRAQPLRWAAHNGKHSRTRFYVRMDLLIQFRRNQHPARKQKLDAGARGRHEIGPLQRRARPSVPNSRGRRIRLCRVRQCA